MNVAFDFETWLIAPARQVPPAVCMSYAEEGGNAEVLTARDGLAYLRCALKAGHTLIGANTPFDVLVSVFAAGDDWHAMLRLWVEAYESGRVRDVLTRQKLLDLAAGRYRGEPNRKGVWIPYRYNLDTVARRNTDFRLAKDNPWRLSFAELDGLAPSEYPPEAYGYALEDSLATLGAFQGQERTRTQDPKIALNFPGLDPLEDEIRQTMAGLPLRAMSAYGIRTDRAAVERLALDVEALAVEARDELEAAGLVRREVTRDMQAIADRCSQLGAASARKADREATGDDLLSKVGNYKAHAEELAKAGLVRIEYKRNTKAAMARCVEAYAELGRAAPMTKPKKKKGAKSEPVPRVSLDTDACERSEDPLLMTYAEYASLGKTLTTDIPMLRSGAELPVHTRFEDVLATGRTSSSGPNLQNIRRLPGIRECFKPREGYVFLDADYPMLELHTLAQVCYWQFGFSTLGDALRNGEDPHLRMASTILSRPYAELKARRAAGDAEVDNARTAGKGVNFGAPGGLGKSTFAQYAWKSYRIRLSEDDAAVLIRQYKDTWKEIPLYFRWINSLAADGKNYNVVQPWSGRLRAGASYCSACNSPFQGLGADVEKLALWLIFKACNGLSELGFDDPLWGSKLVLEVHDSNMVEAPIAKLDAAGKRLAHLMKTAAEYVLSDVGMREIDVLATKQWSKKAKAVYDETGLIIAWDLREDCRAALDKAQIADRGTAYEYLIKKDYPRDVAREIVTERFGGANVVGSAA
jgi:hypothetical protein